MTRNSIDHQFVEFTPPVLEQGILYVSVEYGTASHLCCCGCGEKVVTPITPTDWKLIFNGDTVSLHPSIGNWSFACRSHYWIKEDQVVWAGDMPEETVARVRANDVENKARYYRSEKASLPERLKTFLKSFFG